MRMTITSLAASAALLSLLSCSGGGGGSSNPSGPTYATSLSYTNPTSGAFQFVKDPSSSGATLVLDLVSTSGAPIGGVSFSLSADTGKISWPSSGAVQNGTAFNLGTAPQALASKISGSELQGAASQKGTSSLVTPTSSTVLSKVTLVLKGGVTPGGITLTDSGKGSYLDAAGPHNTAIAVGTLSAQ